MAKQQKLIRDAAIEALAFFDELTEEERQSTQNQGDIQHYSDDAQLQRMNIRQDKRVRRQLRRWWAASKLYDDKDNDLDLDKEEYAKFHGRLLRLLTENDDPDDNLSEEEARAAMESDFQVGEGTL